MENQYVMRHPPLEAGDERISQNNILYIIFRNLAEEEQIPPECNARVKSVIGEV